MSKIHRYRIAAVALTLVTGLAVACTTDGSTVPTGTVLAGLTKVSSNDSSGSTDSTNSGPGYFRGTVMGPSAPGSGNDSLVTAPRIANVRVTIYPRVQSSTDTIATGPAAGSVLTNATGLFQLPTLPAGQYVVTFVPPEGSIYRGSYAFGPLHSKSSDYPWWVVLTKK